MVCLNLFCVKVPEPFGVEIVYVIESKMQGFLEHLFYLCFITSTS